MQKLSLTLPVFSAQIFHTVIDLILGDLLQSLFSVVDLSAPDNIVQSKLVSVTKTAFLKTESQRSYRDKCLNYFKTVC